VGLLDHSDLILNIVAYKTGTTTIVRIVAKPRPKDMVTAIDTKNASGKSGAIPSMVVAAIGIEGYNQVMSVIVITIAISVYAHGISATPLSERYGASRPSRDM